MNVADGTKAEIGQEKDRMPQVSQCAGRNGAHVELASSEHPVEGARIGRNNLHSRHRLPLEHVKMKGITVEIINVTQLHYVRSSLVS